MPRQSALSAAWVGTGAAIASGFFATYLMLDNIEDRNRWGAIALILFMGLIAYSRVIEMFKLKAFNAMVSVMPVAGFAAGFLIGRGGAGEFESSTRDDIGAIWATTSTKIGLAVVLGLLIALGVLTVRVWREPLTPPAAAPSPPPPTPNMQQPSGPAS